MIQHDKQEPDSIDELLATPKLHDEARALRQQVLLQTLGVLRFRRRLRKASWTVGLAASIAVIALGIRWLTPGPVLPRPETAELPQSSPVLTLPAPEVTALALEWRALDSPDRQTELYRQAGDRYLADGTDLQAALRCYGNALSTGTEADLKPTTSDSWLLLAIKDAREKENRDANGM